MRHLPKDVAERVRRTEDASKLKRKDYSKDPLETVFYSDVHALLWAQTPPEESNHTLAFVLAGTLGLLVPTVTASRWRRALRLTEEGPEALARRLARTLALKPKWFNVVAGKGLTQLDERSTVRLMAPKYDETWEPMPWPGNSDPMRAECSARWLGMLPVLHRLPQACSVLSDRWGFQVNAERMQRCASAVERGESCMLCGGMAAKGDVLSGPERRIKPRRGLDGVGSEWLLQVVTEVSDEDQLENGDSARLLAMILEEQVVHGERRLLPQVHGLPPAFSCEAWLHLCKRYGLTWHIAKELEKMAERKLLAGEEGDQGPDEEEDPRFLPDPRIMRFVEAEEAIFQMYNGKEVPAGAKGACGALVLEVMVQYMVADETVIVGGADHTPSVQVLINEFLWKDCGWDTPLGKRLLRRICRVYDRYASGNAGGTLTKVNWFRLCNDAGWATSKDHATKNQRFDLIFRDAVGDAPTGTLIDFIFMVEIVAIEVIEPMMSEHHHHREGKAGTWCAIEIATSDIVGSYAGSPRSRGGQSAVTVRQKQPPRPKAKAKAVASSTVAARGSSGTPAPARNLVSTEASASATDLEEGGELRSSTPSEDNDGRRPKEAADKDDGEPSLAQAKQRLEAVLRDDEEANARRPGTSESRYSSGGHSSRDPEDED